MDCKLLKNKDHVIHSFIPQMFLNIHQDML